MNGNMFEVVIKYPQSFVVEQLDRNVVRVSMPLGDGAVFTPEFTRVATTWLGPKHADQFIDLLIDEALTELVKQSGTSVRSLREDPASHRE